MTAYRASALDVERVQKEQQEFYLFSPELECPACGKNNPSGVLVSNGGPLYTYSSPRKWLPRRFWRRIGHFLCRCGCGATWRELPRGRPEGS